MKRTVVILVWALAIPASAHNGPVQLPPPQSDGEAWNVIEESCANVDKLIDGRLLRDVTFQLANIAAALHTLKESELTKRMLTTAGELAVAIRNHSEPFEQTKARWQRFKETLGELELKYPPAVVHAAVYVCPMHPLDRHLKEYERCSICQMHLVRRHLPASSVYEKPGEATMKMTLAAPPLEVGKRADVRIRLTKNDGSPVSLDDLIEVHTRKIHLLINDRSLADYHHEHPEPTDMPGEYAFSFTPAKSGAYRIWADVVPAATGAQEYVVGDLTGETKPMSVIDRRESSRATVNGRAFAMAFESPTVHAGQTVIGTVTVAGSDGKPFTELEPIMGAFAHIVGFNEDLQTVVHIHPAGAEPKQPTDRGGPAFAFRFYAPTAGFYRLYVQTQVDRKAQFAPFGVIVGP